MRLRSPLRLALVGLALIPGGGGADAPPSDLLATLDRLEGAWTARSVDAYLALWAPGHPERAALEAEFASSHFGAEETGLSLQRPSQLPAGPGPVGVIAQVFTVTEPRGRVEHWRFVLEKHAEGWVITAREDQGYVDGLVHLSLSPGGFRADGLSLRLDDFELRMKRGALFTSPASLGPTAIVFVGDGEVRISPRPAAEREQLRQLCGKLELVDKVKRAFVRIHPADLHYVLFPARLDPDPGSAERFSAAQRFYRSQSQQAFVLDADLPRSPWWLLPSLGDALIAFETDHDGTLTYAVNRGDPEDLSLFDRRRRRQICMYASAGRPTRYSEDDRRTIDILHHDLAVRFEPDRYDIAGQDTLRLRLLAPASTIRLRLDDALRVESVTSREGGRHLFFRVRGQNSLVVSLGPFTGSVGELALTVRYAGTLNPGTADEEVQAPTPPLPGGSEDEVVAEKSLVYSTRNAWYPRGDSDDFAQARLRFDTPAGLTAVTGGERLSEQTEGDRTLVEYRQDRPGKYITAAVGRFADVGMRQEGPIAVRGFGLPRTRDEAAAFLPAAQRILHYYEEEFGPCPYPTLNLAVTEGRTPGGHSPPGMVLIRRRPTLVRRPLRDDPASFDDVPGFFLAHELAHQWWGQGAAGENYRERWLTEGAAQYAAALWVRNTSGKEAFREVLKRMASWAQRYAHEGPINLGHRLGHIRENPQIYRAIVYDKGAYVLHMLRAIVGEEAFRKGVQSFQTQHRYGKAGTEDFREALEAASGKDLSAYFHEWIFGTALPILRYSHRSERTDGRFRTTVSVRTQDLPGPVPLELSVAYEGGRLERVVTLNPGGGTWTLDTPGRPGKVEINRDRTLLARVDGD